MFQMALKPGSNDAKLDVVENPPPAYEPPSYGDGDRYMHAVTQEHEYSELKHQAPEGYTNHVMDSPTQAVHYYNNQPAPGVPIYNAGHGPYAPSSYPPGLVQGPELVGHSRYPRPVEVSQHAAGSGTIHDYMAWSVMNIICCCWLLGIVAAIFSCSVRNKLAQGWLSFKH